MTTGMFDSFVTRHWFSAEAKQLWSDEYTLQVWLDVEAALATAQSKLGLIPEDAAVTIAHCADVSLFELDKLAAGISFAQHPLVPVLHEYEALCGNYAAGYLHWGATTQNIFDTAASLQMHRTHALLVKSLTTAIDALAQIALEHRSTPMAGRTHGQHALPMTFGFKVAGWVDELDRDRDRLVSRVAHSFPAQMGGAVGSFAAMNGHGRKVEALLAYNLGLQPASLPLRSSNDRATDYVAALGILAATAEKVAQSIVFMQRTEIGEVAEAFHMGKVGSSTMAQKRNPSTALLLVSLSRMLRARVPAFLETMVRMDEGDSSSTNITDTLLPEIGILAASVAETLAKLAEGLNVQPAVMMSNLSITRGLINSEAAMMRLTRHMGRHEAHRILYESAQHSVDQTVPLAEAIRLHPDMAAIDVDELLGDVLDPNSYLGESSALAEETATRVRTQR